MDSVWILCGSMVSVLIMHWFCIDSVRILMDSIVSVWVPLNLYGVLHKSNANKSGTMKSNENNKQQQHAWKHKWKKLEPSIISQSAKLSVVYNNLSLNSKQWKTHTTMKTTTTPCASAYTSRWDYLIVYGFCWSVRIMQGCLGVLYGFRLILRGLCIASVWTLLIMYRFCIDYILLMFWLNWFCTDYVWILVL